MKKLKILIVLVFIGGIISAHDLYLLPEKFFLHMGDLLSVHMLIGDDFAEDIEKSVNKKDVSAFLWFTPNKTEDLLIAVRDSIKPVMYQRRLDFSGLGMLAVTRNYFNIELTRQKFTAYLEEERLNNILKIRDTFNGRSVEREKYTRYIKTLVCVDKPVGEVYKKRIGQTLEIIMLTDPYTVKKQAALQAQVFFKNAPLVNTSLEVLCKQPSGAISKKAFYSDKEGKITFHADKTGSWMVRLTYMLPSRTPDADWESFWASYTFGRR